MEDYQKVGDALAKAITEGNLDDAFRLLQEAATLDAQFEVILEPQRRDVEEVKIPEGGKVQQKNSEIYEKLIEMGVDRNKALNLASKCKSLDEALSIAFN
jgi:hypothetical protein